MSYILYHVPDWGSSVIRLVLEEIGAPFTIAPLDWDAGDFDSPAFRAVNPLGLVPALQTPDGPVFETAAIILWLNARHGGLGPGPTDPERGAFRSWLMFTSNTLHQTVLTLIHPDRVAGEQVQDIVQARALEHLNEDVAQLEAMIAKKDPDWLSPRKPGALGYYLGILLRWAMYLPEDPGMRFSLRPYPALRAVLAAHERFPAALRTASSDGLGDTPFTAPDGALE
ncbi:MAG: glutathione S-transferase family protein [Rhodobacterales bacterium]|nr:glutathione S-transferase family protein [Rhodobacterales bacterium]